MGDEENHITLYGLQLPAAKLSPDANQFLLAAFFRKGTEWIEAGYKVYCVGVSGTASEFTGKTPSGVEMVQRGMGFLEQEDYQSALAQFQSAL